MKRTFLLLVLIISGTVVTGLGQNGGNERAADSTLRGSGRVNASTLGMEFELPLGSYPGRGINVPINLSYSSKLWRMTSLGNNPIPGSQYSNCYPHYLLRYAENSASGWTTSLGVPWIEFVGQADHYDISGNPVTDADVTCPTSQGGGGSYPFFYVRRIVVHMPSGETHELRPDDTAIESPPSGSTGSSPYNWANWNATYFAIDSSNLKYVQDSSTSTYRLLMSDGSFYDFNSTTWQATGYTDRNGNQTTYYAPDANYPHGRWVDTLGRSIPIPGAPSSPTTVGNPQVYSLPGMTGSYKFQWKQLNGGTQAESALTDISDPNYQLKYLGETYVCNNPYPTYCTHPAGTYLFSGAGSDDGRIVSNFLFNPMVLTEIELPTGQKYRFTYDVYGRIERIYYPTGGEERFTYGVVPTISKLGFSNITGQTNFGVTSRKVYESENDPTPYIWAYEATYTEPLGYRVTINNPDGTKVERFLHRGNDDCEGCGVGTFGYDNGLAGMAYEERVYDDSSPAKLVSKKLTNWTLTTKQLTMQTSSGSYPGPSYGRWHSRVASEESLIYDPAANGISATTTFEYEGDLTLRETPVLIKRSSQYEFVTAGSPLPANPVKVSENTFLMNDPNYASVKTNYTNQNMVGLVTASEIRDGAGTIVSRSETVYDESGRSPGYRGNPTTDKVWDSAKGLVTNPAAYISTSARFDTYGNQYEVTDAKGNTTTTTFDTTYNAFPVQVTSPVPDPTGENGSNTAFVSTATFDYTTGLPSTTTDANGLETRIEYDPVTLRPRFTRTYFNNVQVGSISETVYHDETNNYWVKNRSQIDEYKWAETTTYFDGLGRAWKTEEINSNGNVFVEKEFDSEGRIKRVTNPFRANETKYWTTNVYDEASRVKEVILQDGATVKTDYGVSVTAPIGVTKTITDQAGKKRKGYTDALGRMVRVVEDPTGQAFNTDYVFDTLGNLRKTIQGEQNRSFMHDSLGRLLYAKQPEQSTRAAFAATDPVTGNTAWSVKYEYDDNSNITKTTDARGIEVTGTYDNLNRIKQRVYSDATPTVSFYYDGTGLGIVPDRSKGKTTKVSSSVSETRYTSFDDLGRLLTHQQITDGQTYNTGYTYNLSGALIEETYPSTRVVKYTLDQNGDLAQVQSKKTANHGYWTYADSFSYDSAGAVKKMQLGNGRWETDLYNERLQIKQIGLGTTDADQNQLKLELSYGTSTQNNGSLREQKITVPGIANAFIQTYTYDDLNRLKSATETNGGAETWKQTFEIDRYGNREFDAANTTTLGSCPQAICNPDIRTADNRFSSGQGYSYDLNGNVTQDTTGQGFGYDAENHQKEFFATGNATGTPDATYFYDGEGRRIRKVSSTETTVFVYNATGQLVAEYSTQTAQTPQISYLTTDHLGSPRIITNENGTVKDRKDYSAFGEESTSAQRSSNSEYSAADQLRKTYTGYEKDGESGLEFAQARYYNAGHGRFTSVDPLTASASIRNPQTFNRYSYVLNSPYKFVDPLGLLSSSTGACGQWCPGSDEGSLGFGGGGHEDVWGNFLQQQQDPPKKKDNKSKNNGRKNKETKSQQQTQQQTPTSLQAVKVEVLKLGNDGDSGCTPTNAFGVKIAVTYQVLDQNGKPIKNNGMVAQEKVAEGDLKTAEGEKLKVSGTNGEWKDIGPSRNSQTSRTTNDNGQFVDAPLGMCGPGSFEYTFEQQIRIKVGNKNYNVRSQKFTVTASPIQNNQFTNTISNGSDVNARLNINIRPPAKN